MGEILGRCCDIALSFAMITFPPFIAIPAGISVYFRNPRRRFIWMLTIPLIIAIYILVIAVLFTDVDLIRNGGSLNVTLAIVMSIAAVLIIYFLVIMANYLFELALEAEYERASLKIKTQVA